MFFFDRFHSGRVARDLIIFAETAVACAIGIICAFLLFPSEAALIAVFLIALAQANTVELLLDRNREEIWNQELSPRRANWKLARSLLVLFLGILLTYVAAVMITPEDRLLELFDRQIGKFAVATISDVNFGSFANIFLNNAGVLVICFLFALLYRHGGMLLVLAWNASVWGVVFAYLIRSAGRLEGVWWPIYLLKAAICILPHLLLEALGYIVIAMSGVFLSKALQKYSIDSPQFAQVGRAILLLAGVAGAVLCAATALEVYLAPALVRVLF